MPVLISLAQDLFYLFGYIRKDLCMATYRVLQKLHVGKSGFLDKGSMSRLEWLNEKQIDRLELVGAVSRVKPPPLIALPGFSLRARKMEEVTQGKIENAEQFLEADNSELAKLMEVKETTIEKWKKEAMKWLTVEPGIEGR